MIGHELQPSDGEILHNSEEIGDRLPSAFTQTVARVKTFVLQEFDSEIVTQQLYYHTRDHIEAVQRRADIIFKAIYPSWKTSLGEKIAPDYFSRMYLILDLCAIAHDMVQSFIPQNQPHTSRRRESSVSEKLTLNKLLNYIQELDRQLEKKQLDYSVRFTSKELLTIQEAITATICQYDLSEQAVYQPALYDSSKSLSPVSRILALADIGALGIEGIESYNREGSLLFLEENPDVIPILKNQDLESLALNQLELYENIRQRLLKRARFQVNFAKSRLYRYAREIKDLPGNASSVLTQEVFKYLNQETIQEIELITPTQENTSVTELIKFFKLYDFVRSIAN